MKIKKLIPSFYLIISFVTIMVTGLMLTTVLIELVQAKSLVAVVVEPGSISGQSGGQTTTRLPTSTQTITTSPEILYFHEAANRPSVYEPSAVQTSNLSAQALNCNPSGGTGGLGVGTHDTTIAGHPATVIVGAGYDPSKPTYLALYLHGDEGGYNFHTSSFSPINQFINTNSWIYVAPQAAKATNGDYYPWDGRGGGSIEANETQVKDIFEHMFTNYNVCRDILFGGSVSGGS